MREASQIRRPAVTHVGGTTHIMSHEIAEVIVAARSNMPQERIVHHTGIVPMEVHSSRLG